MIVTYKKNEEGLFDIVSSTGATILRGSFSERDAGDIARELNRFYEEGIKRGRRENESWDRPCSPNQWGA